jgi:3-hydroxyacyl-[acyl-carrier-protein] dehydratase
VYRGFDVAELTAGPDHFRLAVHVHAEAPQFEGHFPGNAVLPAVAELSDLVLPAIARAWPDLPALSGSPRMKFGRTVAPGDRLMLELHREGADAVRFELAHADGVCASGVLGFG